MKNIFFVLFATSIYFSFGQIPAYYSSVDFTLVEFELKNELSELITSTHTSPTTYDEVWDVLKLADLDPTNAANVLLVYGFNDDDGIVSNDRSRDKNNNGGSSGQWNREHVFPKSLGSPDLGTSGPGSDPHNLRASDVTTNGTRDNRKFVDGGGNAGVYGPNWYPGDEWKGDVARIVMYMYLRYGNRCLPSFVAVGAANDIDGNMIDLLLEWNAEDNVSAFEISRNNRICEAIGNRNPFIDNPRIANRIWGGMLAEDTWGGLSIQENYTYNHFSIYPNPVLNNEIYVSNSTYETIISIDLYDLKGNKINTWIPAIQSNNLTLQLESIPAGLYLLNLESNQGREVKKICIL
jgi:endonuclease I